MVSKLAELLARLGAWAGGYVGTRTAAPIDLEPNLNPHVTFDRSTADWSMSPASRRIACRSPHVEIARRRRRNYEFLAEQLVGLSGARPLRPTLPNGTCPLAFPLVVDEPLVVAPPPREQRNRGRALLERLSPGVPRAGVPREHLSEDPRRHAADSPGPRSRPPGTRGRRHAPVVAAPYDRPFSGEVRPTRDRDHQAWQLLVDQRRLPRAPSRSCCPDTTSTSSTSSS